MGAVQGAEAGELVLAGHDFPQDGAPYDEGVGEGAEPGDYEESPAQGLPGGILVLAQGD